MIVGTANFCVVTTFGSECGLTDLEGKLLIPSVQRTLERMPAAAAAKAAIIIDPLIIATVAIMWTKRIAQTKDREAKEKYQIQPTEQARADGATGFTYSVPPEQQTVRQPPADLEALRQRQAAEQLRAVQSASVAATNGVSAYGAPDYIRESFASDAEF